MDIGAGPGDLQAASELLDAPSLSFLLPSGGLEIYKELSMAQEAYSSYAMLVSRRNRLLWETIYPVTDPLLNQQLSSTEFDRRVVSAIGTSPLEQVNQAAYHMLATDKHMRVIGSAKVIVHQAMSGVFDKAEVPPLGPELWPAGREIPDCSVVDENGHNARVHRHPLGRK